MDLATGLEKGFILLEFEGQSYKIWVKVKNKYSYVVIIITYFIFPLSNIKGVLLTQIQS